MIQKENIISSSESDLNKIKILGFSFFEKIKFFFQPFIKFFKNKNNSGKILFLLSIFSLIGMLYLIFTLFIFLRTLRAKTPELINLVNYDTTALHTNPITKEILPFSKTIFDLIQKRDSLKEEINKYSQYMQNLQLPYENFLKYIYLPSLNIWKNEYTNEIDITMIGEDFLKKNPYNDVVLLQKWSDFFKNIGDNNEFNEISNISIGDIVETSDNYFFIPITVSFTAHSKRNFLMLIDKLSITSNKNTLALIDEFFYYLWQEIKKQKKSELLSLMTGSCLVLGTGISEDMCLGYSLYNWIYGTGQNVLIDDIILENTIKSLMSCVSLDINQCYFQFREKFRDLPSLAYGISKDLNQNTVDNFKKFFFNLPPITLIQDFTFDKVESTDINNFTKFKYKGQAIINVYGKGISQEEIEQIALVLGKQCFKENQALSIDDALNLVNDAILKQSDAAGSDRSKIQDLFDLKEILENIITQYPQISNFKKIVRLFEVWRMLDDNGFCQ